MNVRKYLHPIIKPEKIEDLTLHRSTKDKIAIDNIWKLINKYAELRGADLSTPYDDLTIILILKIDRQLINLQDSKCL